MGMDTRLFFLLNQTQGRLYKMADKACKDGTGFSVIQNAALLALDKNQGCSLSQLRKMLKINKASLGALVERMRKKDLVSKSPDTSDARITRLHTLPKGEETLSKLRPLMASLNEQLRGDFSDEEIKTVVRFLHHASALADQKSKIANSLNP